MLFPRSFQRKNCNFVVFKRKIRKTYGFKRTYEKSYPPL